MYGTRLKRGVKLTYTPLLLFIAAFSVLGSILLLQARADTFTTYYVATGGSDSNKGTADAPWRTIQRSLSKLSPGDTLIVKGGMYNEQIQDPPIRPGVPNARITVKTAAGERPVLAGLLWLTDANYWTIDGLNVTWNSANIADQYMVKFSNGTGWRMTNSEVWGARSYAAVLVAGVPSEWSLDHNYIHDTYKSNGPNQDHLVYVSGGMGGGTITRNIIANSPNGRGIKIGPQSGGSEAIGTVSISYNTLYNNTGPSNIQLSYGATNNVIFKNILVKSGASNITAYNVSGSGNTAYDNVGWDAERVLDATDSLTDGTNNNLVDPQLDVTTYMPKSADYVSYGRYAPGDSQATGATPISAMTAVTSSDSQAPAAPSDLQAYVRSSVAVGLEWTSTDTSDIAGYVVYRDGSQDGISVGPVTDYIDARIELGKTYSYQVAAVDNAGNTSAKTALVFITTPAVVAQIDSVAPSLRVSSPVGGSTLTGPTTIEATATDDIGIDRVEFRVDTELVATDTAAPYQYGWDFRGTVGTHTVDVRAVDGAGNARSASVTVQTGTANAATGAIPAPTDVTAVSSGGGQVNVAWKATDAYRVDVYRNDRLIRTVRGADSYGDSYKLQVGKTYTYYVVARDQAGYASAHSASVTVTPKASDARGGWGGGIITGRVTNISGVPLPGARVTVNIDGATVTGLSNKQGMYILYGVPANTYQMTVVADGYRTQTDYVIAPSGVFKIKNMALSQ